MSIELKDISIEQKERILNLEEGHFYDLKAKEITPKKLARHISAFANADGGELFIGIEEEPENKENRTWFGFNNQEDANGYLQPFLEFFPLSKYFNYEFLETDDEAGVVLHISINKTSGVTKSTDGIPYVRRGAQSIPIKDHEGLKRLEYDKGITSFERQTLDIPKDLITNSDVIRKFISEVIPSTTPEPWLRKQIFLSKEMPTVGGTLLFCDEPQAALAKQSGIKIYRYKTKEKEGKREQLDFDPLTIEGPVYHQIYSAVNKTTEIIQAVEILTDTGLEKAMYPNEAIHEIITNSVLHRDYSIAKDIHIRIFDNRIEVESPGRLPGHVSPENILDEQLARNGSIVRIVNKFPDPPNKDVGEGLNTAFEAFRKLRLKPPKIEETESSVIVTLRHEPLASPESIVMSYIKTKKEINNSTGRDLTGIDSENEMKRVFQRLQARNLIYLDPNRKGSASRWLIKEEHRNGLKTVKVIQGNLFD